jgi:hypothetical protein
VRRPAASLTASWHSSIARTQLGEQARDWVIENHGPTLAARAIELCQEAVSEAAGRRTTIR